MSEQRDSNKNAITEQPKQVKKNRHLSPTSTVTTLKNGLNATENGHMVASSTTYSPPQSAQNQVTSNGNQGGSPSTPPHSSHEQNQNSPPHSSHNNCGNLPNSYSPNTQTSQSPTSSQSQPSRGESPHGQNQNSPPGQQHVVHIHVNPGETFCVRVGDQVQHIHGPATIRMVSNNGPPLPMPMQVPPGHMVQQIVDEHGILTHVILSPQPQSMMGTPMTGGGPSNAAQYYPGYGPHYPGHPQYPSPHHHSHHGHSVSPHMHTGVPHTHPQGTPPPATNVPSGPVHTPAGPSPPVNTMEDRATRQRARVKKKYLQRLEEGCYTSNRAPPRRTNLKTGKGVNGETMSGMSHTENGPELEEERRVIQQQLSNMPEPKITEIEARSALIQLAPPDYDQNEFDIDPADFRYELQLSDKGKDGRYKLVYSGDATEIALKDLKPSTEYYLRICTLLDDLKGSLTEAVSFKTAICEPDQPQQPKLSSKTKTSITLKWNAPAENGAKISTYSLEYDQGQGDNSFSEVYNGLQKQYRVSKLQASTRYTFKLAAISSVGKSQFSESGSFFTSGSAPSQPDPPMLSDCFVKALTISWIKRPNDDEFLLQLDDEATGHGFITLYNGPNLSHKINNLRRNTDYKFRLSAKNDEGQSKWSDMVCYRTRPDKPSPPGKPQIKGKIHAHSFRVTWDPPKDNGGSELTKYIVELDGGREYETLYEGTEREHVCDHLVPGHMYKVRAACCSEGGRSDFSECCVASTQAVPPGQCQVPKLQGKPKATSLHLRWGNPDYEGGATVSEFAAQMIPPDNLSREVYKGRDLDCIVAGLSPGRPYLFQVRAFNRTGGGPWSELLEVVSGAGVPDPPKPPLVNCKSPHCAIISWEEPVNNGATITDYKLEWQHKVEQEFSQLYFGPLQTYEVKGLTPATLYSFRVQAINTAGPGPYSLLSSCITPPSSPSPVVSMKCTYAATTISLQWKEPHDNGSEIVAFNIDIGEKIITVNAVTEYVIEDLVPESTYKIRIQAVNGIGVGAFSMPVKITTRTLPPNPPRLECICAGPSSLKLKWGIERNMDIFTYTLEMEKEDGNFSPVYVGPAHSHKVNKLSEVTTYDFRIYASNEAGDGAYSDIYSFTTTKAPPPALKVPRINRVDLHSCVVEWASCRTMGADTIVYCLQLQGREQDYKQVYRGPGTSHHLHNLTSKTEYHARVSAIRQCETGDLSGAFSPGILFTTLSPEPEKSTVAKVPDSKIVEPKELTDQQWAVIILLGFVVFAVLVALVAQQIISYTSGHSGRHEETL